MQNTQASYPRVCTHESQSFFTKLLEFKATDREHLPQANHPSPTISLSQKFSCIISRGQSLFQDTGNLPLKGCAFFFSTPQSAGKSFEWSALYVRGYLICVLCISIPLRTYQRERRMTLKLFPADCEALKKTLH